MGYEIDFLAVERGEKSGDAIAFRIGNLNGRRDEQFVGIVDGGYTEDGEQLAKHVRQHYGTDVVDLVVASHSDDDHSQGLVPVLEQMDVRLLWMHQPWNHADKIRRMFTNDRLTTRGLSDKFTRSLASAKSVERVAMQLGVPIVEPFAGEGVVAGNRVYVAGPSREVLPASALRLRLCAGSQADGPDRARLVLRRRRDGGSQAEARAVGCRDTQRRMLDQRGEQLEHHPADRCRRGVPGCSPVTRARLR